MSRIYNIGELKELYRDTILRADEQAAGDNERAYGGIIRETRGAILEYLVQQLVKIAWVTELQQDEKDLTIDRRKEDVKINKNYINNMSDSVVRDYLKLHENEMVYKFGTDVQVRIRGELVIAIECKSYTENAMLKRIIFDAELMKQLHPNINKYYLIQAQSMLGGDYSQLPEHVFGSPATNTLLSLSTVPIEIITLIEGERDIQRPIYDPRYYRPINENQMQKVVDSFVEELRPYTN